MSFNITMLLYPGGIEDADFHSAFAGKLCEISGADDEWTLGECTVSCVRDNRGILVEFRAYSITGDSHLWEVLFKILSRGNTVLSVHRAPLIPIVCDPNAVDLIPRYMRGGFGAPHIVSSIQELIDAVDIDARAP